MKTMIFALAAFLLLPVFASSAQAETIHCRVPPGRDIGLLGLGLLQCTERVVEIASLGPNVKATGGTLTIRCPGWSPRSGTNFVGARVQLGLSAGAFVSSSGVCFVTGINIGGAAELMQFTIN